MSANIAASRRTFPGQLLLARLIQDPWRSRGKGAAHDGLRRLAPEVTQRMRRLVPATTKERPRLLGRSGAARPFFFFFCKSRPPTTTTKFTLAINLFPIHAPEPTLVQGRLQVLKNVRLGALLACRTER